MASFPPYVILGGGRWARIIANILTAEGRSSVMIGNLRNTSSEHLSASLRSCGARIAWICVPPGPHIFPLAQTVIKAGLNVVLEKPWLCSTCETESLITLARDNHVTAGIHHQFCLLAEIEAWRAKFHSRAGLRFGGTFHLSRPNRLGIPAIDNLGSHLFAIHAYAVPRATVSKIDCAYNAPDARQVWLETDTGRVALVDFLATKEPLIQRYIARFEAALDGADFPFDLAFASQLSIRSEPSL